jgi:hypothetical protein
LHFDLRGLQQSAKAHCQICRSIWTSLVDSEKPEIPSNIDTGEDFEAERDGFQDWWDRETSYMASPTWKGVIDFYIGKGESYLVQRIQLWNKNGEFPSSDSNPLVTFDI